MAKNFNEYFQAMKAVSKYEENTGVNFVVCHDIEKFHLESNKVGFSTSKEFSMKKYDFSEENFFWIAAYKNDELYARTAARLDRIGTKPLSEFWRLQQPRIYGGVIGHDHAPNTQFINGKIVYQGETRSNAASRGTGIGSALNVLNMLTAIHLWDPDYIYGFMSKELIKTGYGIKAGYAYQVPIATDWHTAPEKIDPSDWLVYNDRHSAARCWRIL